MYIPVFWKDRIVQYPRRVSVVDLGNGVKEWTPTPGEIHQKGTQQSATNFGNEDMGILEGNLIAATNAIHLRLIQESVDDLRGQVLTATLTNSLKYPATNSAKTITLPKIVNKTDYKVDIEVAEADGPVEYAEVFDNQKINALNGTVTVIYKGVDGLNIRKAPSYTAAVDQIVHEGVFTVVGISADEKWYKLKSGLFITTIPDYVSFKATQEQKESTAGTGYFRVRKSWDKADTQIGAFKQKENAIELCKQNSGYKVFDNSGKEIYPCVAAANESFVFRVKIPDLRIRKGPGTTYDYHKKNGQAVHTGVGSFTIVKTKEGPGAKLWGLLKSYATNEDGWIALDDEFGSRV